MIAQATTVAEGILGTTLTSNNAQISIINAFQQDPSKFTMFGDKTEAISNFSLNFLGLNLGEVPQFALNALILIPILSAVAMIASSLITQKLSGSGAAMQGGMGMSTKIMMAVMIGISFFFCFSVPAGVGLYWIIQSLLTIVQAFIVNRFYNPQKMAEEARAQLEERKKKRKNKKVVVVEQTETGETVTVEKNVSQRELDKIRLAKARQMDAEKYGDEADEVKDEDFD
ncbi:Membrane protein insertase YidC [bioreactor metagenome]|uniref:Membrane protein insertase YidC n=1 Tax=bioreactor metagenome TaxID=1076179 RepID=A0A645GIU1_9ZZZZ